MPDGKLSITEFAAKIKAKYPTYKDVDDVTLAKKIIEKYPDYASSVDMSGSEGVKKKEPSVSVVGGQAGISAAPSVSESKNVVQQGPLKGIGFVEDKTPLPKMGGVVGGEVVVDQIDPIKSYRNQLNSQVDKSLEKLLQRERQPKVSTTAVAPKAPVVAERVKIGRAHV